MYPKRAFHCVTLGQFQVELNDPRFDCRMRQPTQDARSRHGRSTNILRVANLPQRVHRGRVFWQDTTPVVTTPPLEGSDRCDVCIVGGGYAGLWTAHFLEQADSSLDVRVVEAEWAGFGASGRNAGHATSALDLSLHHLVSRYGPERAGRAHHALARSVAEIGEFCRRHGVDADYERTGFLYVATNPAQRARLERDAAAAHLIGAGRRFQHVEGEPAREILGAPSIQAVLNEQDAALLNPLKLARGLADTVRRRGVRLYEHTRVRRIDTEQGLACVQTDRGRLHAEHVVIATNADQRPFGALRHAVRPVWGYMMASEPLSAAQRDRLRWPGRQGFIDRRNLYTCGRLTADGRVLWGGRIARHVYGRAPGMGAMHREDDFARLREAFDDFFPMWRDVAFTHRYGGWIGVTRSMLPAVGRLDGRVTYAFGWNGQGVVATHAAAQALRDLVLGRESEHTQLLFVNGPRPDVKAPELVKYLMTRAAIELARRQDRAHDHGLRRRGREPLVVRAARGMPT